MGLSGGHELLLPAVPAQPPRCGAVVVGAVIVVGLGVSQQSCGWGEGGRNARTESVCVLVCASGGI